MKRVLKSQQEPSELKRYKSRFKKAPSEHTWTKFKKGESRRESVKQILRQDQRGLCAYCENTLIPEDESVEHFIPRKAHKDGELDWKNLLLCCAGGERPLPEEVVDGAARYDGEGPKTCGHAKLGDPVEILNPLNVALSPRLFRFGSETGEIAVDNEACKAARVSIDLAETTIRVLGLKAPRLNRARRSVMTAITEQLDAPGQPAPLSLDRERELAKAHFLPDKPWPAFFTTIRFILDEGAELHLASLGYQG